MAFATFSLHPSGAGGAGEPPAPQAIFAIAVASGELLVARVVEPGVGGGPARVDDLLAAAPADTGAPAARFNG